MDLLLFSVPLPASGAVIKCDAYRLPGSDKERGTSQVIPSTCDRDAATVLGLLLLVSYSLNMADVHKS